MKKEGLSLIRFWRCTSMHWSNHLGDFESTREAPVFKWICAKANLGSQRKNKFKYCMSEYIISFTCIAPSTCILQHSRVRLVVSFIYDASTITYVWYYLNTTVSKEAF